MVVGVLALQGDWEAHLGALRELAVEAATVRTPGELERVAALILPGGESTAMLRLLAPDRLDRALIDRARAGMPLLATCAGLILLAAGVNPVQPSLGLIDVDVARNAYGRQVHSTVAGVELAGELGAPPELEGMFIRAPRITRVGPKVTVLGRRDREPVLVQEGRILAATFHPELGADRRIHRRLLELVEVTDV